MKQNVHYVEPYLINPQHPLTVTLVGVGGSGSQMLSALARISHALQELGHPGLEVTAWDPDTVEQANIGRQLFSPCDTGLNKAVCLVSRINRFYGTSWKAVPEMFHKNAKVGNLVVSCVDTVAARMQVAEAFRAFTPRYNLREHRPYYWLDLGNSRQTGQVVLGSRDITQPTSDKFSTVSRLPDVTEMFRLDEVDERDSGPSCSLAEALQKQDLFINSTLANLAGSILWSMLRESVIFTQGAFINLTTYQTVPIELASSKE